MNLIEATNISHNFDYTLFENLSFDLKEGESMAIIGVSGSGKSTLLHIISTLLKPKSGSVKLLGQDISKVKDVTTLRKFDLGLIFQSHYLFKGFSGYENLEVAAILSNEKIDDELLKKLKIDQVIKQRVTDLSGGQQQRVSIARVLTKKPRIIFADEPTGNLDSVTADEVMGIFNEYIKHNSACMVLVTHDEELAARCDHLYKLQDLRLLKIK